MDKISSITLPDGNTYRLSDNAEALVKDTVGWTGKNLLKNTATTQTINGVTFTVNADGSITANGTATGNESQLFISNRNDGPFILEPGTYIGSGSPINGTGSTYHMRYNETKDGQGIGYLDFGNGCEFTITEKKPVGVIIYIKGGVTVSNLTFYPMIRKADITDPTYEPYHESVEVMYEEEIHGVNLFDDSKTEVGTAWNGDTNANRARNIIPCEPNSEYIISMNGTNGLQAVFFSVSASIPPASQTIITSFPYTIKTGASDRYITLGFNKTNITLSDVTALKIMIRKADIEDSTYRPYNYQAIQNQLNDKGVLGSKNLLKNGATSQTINGVTFTVNADGSVTANGTATTNIVTINIPISLPIGKYTFSGTNGQSGGSDSKYYARLRKVGGIQFTSSEVSPLPVESINSSEKTFSVLQDGLDIIYQICIYSAAGAISNLTFYPMIRLASDPDDTYQPYAMTNRELTEKVFEKRTLTSSDDLNNITETGIYGVTSAPLNSPESTSYYTLIVQKTSDSDIRQTIFKGGYIYHRYYGGSPISWKSWFKFTGTVVS